MFYKDVITENWWIVKAPIGYQWVYFTGDQIYCGDPWTYRGARKNIERMIMLFETTNDSRKSPT